MTPRQKFFVLEYLIDLNAKGAAIRAGYAPRHARARATALLRRPDIANAIREAMAERAQRTGITVARVIEEYARVAFADLRLVADWGPEGEFLAQCSDLPDETAAAIAFVADLTGQRAKGLSRESFDKRKALEFLARLLGLNLVQPEPGLAPHA
jgi:phage terminase small subunit